jgi:hypothetical protein
VWIKEKNMLINLIKNFSFVSSFLGCSSFVLFCAQAVLLRKGVGPRSLLGLKELYTYQQV